jgi:hypothetical protein
MTVQQLLNQIEALRAAYGKIRYIDPQGPAYKKLCALLDSMDNELLMIVRDAQIKFMSNLAFNRCQIRGLNEVAA